MRDLSGIARVIAGFAAAGLLAASARGQDLYRSAAGPSPVRVSDVMWHDDARNRDVPVRVYRPGDGPDGAERKHPMIVFSHGLGGSGRNYRYFGEHMASWGYVVVAPSHAGSDTASLVEWMRKGRDAENGRDGWLRSSINDPENLKNRPLDVSFVIDRAMKDAALGIDAERIGVAGHSFGAYTSMAVAGMKVDLPGAPDTVFRDPRVKAVLPMSPQGGKTMGIDDGAWDTIGAAVLFLTGTRDYGEGQRSAAWRREAFDGMSGADAFLVVIDGATHMTFGQGGDGRGAPAIENDGEGPLRRVVRDRARERTAERSGGRDADQAEHTALVKSLAAAFFDARLRGDAEAAAWLRAFFAAPPDGLTAEFKPGERAPAPGAAR